MNDVKCLRDDLNSVVMFFQPIGKDFKCGPKTVDTFLALLKGVPDFRDPMKIKYKLENLLFICFYLALKGEFTSFYHAATYVEVKQEWFIERGLVKEGELPSHDTFMRIFQYLDANGLRDTFLNKIKYLTERLIEIDQSAKDKHKLISGDGKEIKGSGRSGRFYNINMFNIYCCSNGICLSCTPLSDKESEIPEFQRLLPKFNLKNCMVTADALHCQKDTCSIILERKGNYTIKVKDNQKELKEDIIHMLAQHAGKTVSVSHNSCDYKILILSRTYIGADWPGARAYIQMISHKRIHQKDYNPEPQYFVSSAINTDLIMETVDNRWGIEDDLHRFKDSFLNEDKCTFTNPNALKTMATLNNIVFALYKLAAAVNNETMDRTKIRYHDDPMEMLSLILPLLNRKNVNQLIRENMRGTKRSK